MEKIELNAPSLKGEIYIGRGAAKERLPRLTEGQRNFVVTDSNVFSLYGTFFPNISQRAKYSSSPPGKRAKILKPYRKFLPE